MEVHARKGVALTKLIAGGTATIGVLIVALLGYRWLRTDIAADVYRQRLEHLARDYEDLRQTYNQAVRRSAVTELLVKDGSLCVRIRTPQGVLRTIDTPFDPSGEIYVDFLVLDGRLWIRRVFDSKTPPHRALVIDPLLEEVDWSDAALVHGKAVYRSLDEGRWVVTATGDGSLGLARAPEDEPIELVGPPEVRDYQTLEREIDQELGEIGLRQVVRHAIGDQ